MTGLEVESITAVNVVGNTKQAWYYMVFVIAGCSSLCSFGATFSKVPPMEGAKNTEDTSESAYRASSHDRPEC